MTKDDRKLLTEACGLEWHEDQKVTAKEIVAYRDREGVGIKEAEALLKSQKVNHSFATSDDWELVREKVVITNLDNFTFYIFMENDGPRRDLAWFLILSPEQRCQLAVDWLKARA